MSQSGSARLLWVDAARSLAVALALLAHGFALFKALPVFSPAARAALRIVFHLATPTFLLLFGAMLEIVALRRLRGAGPVALRTSLLRRGLLCYLAYAATTGAAFLTGSLDLVEAARALVLLHHVPYGNILAYYTLALLAAVPLVRLVDRAGIGPVLAGASGLWALFPLFAPLPWPRRGAPLAELTNLLVGLPTTRVGISYLQSLVIVVFGMLLGRAALEVQRSGERRPLERALLAGMAATALCVACLVVRDGPGSLYSGYLQSNSLRLQQAVGYIAISGFSALALLLVLVRMIPPGRTYRTPGGWPLLFGRYSLAAFALGNILLIAAPAGLSRIQPAWARVVLPFGHLLLVAVLLTLWQRLRDSVERRRRAGALGDGTPVRAGA